MLLASVLQIDFYNSNQFSNSPGVPIPSWLRSCQCLPAISDATTPPCRRFHSNPMHLCLAKVVSISHLIINLLLHFFTTLFQPCMFFLFFVSLPFIACLHIYAWFVCCPASCTIASALHFCMIYNDVSTAPGLYLVLACCVIDWLIDWLIDWDRSIYLSLCHVIWF